MATVEAIPDQYRGATPYLCLRGAAKLFGAADAKGGR